LIAVLDFDFYSRYSKDIDRYAKTFGIIVWSIDTTQKRLRKHVGQHIDKKLNRIFHPDIVLSIHPWCPSLVLFTRQTDQSVKAFYFTTNLISALVQESKIVFNFSEIDKIMVESNPPKFAHLIPQERKQEWKALLYKSITHLKILKQSNAGPNTYELQNPAILENPYSRNKLLEDLKKQLRIVK
jgi:hypothetical protein